MRAVLDYVLSALEVLVLLLLLALFLTGLTRRTHN